MLITAENSSVQHRQTPSNVRRFWAAMCEIFKPRNMQTRANWKRATKFLHNHNINIFMVLISYVNKCSTGHSGKKECHRVCPTGLGVLLSSLPRVVPFSLCWVLVKI